MKKPLSDRIREHRPEWDKDAFWSQLEPELPRRPKRRLLAWWWLGAGLFLVTLGGIAYAWGKKVSLQALPVPMQLAVGNDTVTAMPSDPVTESQIRNKTVDMENTSRVKPSNSNWPLKDSLSLISAATALQAASAATGTPYIATDDQSKQTATAALSVPSRLPTLTILPVYPSPVMWEAGTVFLTQAYRPRPSSRWFHSIQAGVAYVTHSVEAENAAVRLSWSERQGQIREAVALEYHLGWQHSSGWFAQLGMAFQQRRELLEWEGVVDSIRVSRTVDEAYAYTGQDGQTLYQSGEVEVTELTRRRIVQQNYFYTLDMPAIIGYRYQKERWAWQVQAGVRVNLWHHFRGKWVGLDNEVLDANRVNSGLLRPSLGVGWSVGTGVAYQFGARAEAFGQLRYQQFGTPVTQGQPYSIRYQQWGLQFGIRRYF